MSASDPERTWAVSPNGHLTDLIWRGVARSLPSKWSIERSAGEGAYGHTPSKSDHVWVELNAGPSHCRSDCGPIAPRAGPHSNSTPNPYRMQADWLQLPAGRGPWARPSASRSTATAGASGSSTAAAAHDCGHSQLDPIMKFDAYGKLVTSFGAGLFNHPHGSTSTARQHLRLRRPRQGNGKGHRS